MRERCRNGRRLALACAGVALAMMAAPAPAPAQTVQKCVAASGHVTLTSGDCGAGERLTATWDATPEPEPASGPRVDDKPRPTASGRSPARSGSHAATRTRAPGRRCEAARERRESTLQRVGLKRSFDLLRRLDEEVWAACR